MQLYASGAYEEGSGAMKVSSAFQLILKLNERRDKGTLTALIAATF